MTNPTPSAVEVTVEQAKRIVFRHLFPQHLYYTECEMQFTLEREQDSDRRILPSTVLAAVTEALSLGRQSATTGAEVPSGWKLVPVEPTEEMVVDAVHELRLPWRLIPALMRGWETMLFAAPAITNDTQS